MCGQATTQEHLTGTKINFHSLSPNIILQILLTGLHRFIDYLLGELV